MEIKKYINILSKNLPAVSIVMFALLTFCLGIFSGRIPWEDEAHAWTIAQNTNLFQLINLMKVEGHFLVWYLCLMPFAKLDLFYPYSMFMINWLFCLLAIYILWKKAPFNNTIKFFITFSAPFLAIYSQSARCYSVGILFLFMAMSFYKTRLINPYKYLLCLILSANTCLPLCIASGILGSIFVYDLVKNKYRRVLFITLGAVFLNLLLFYFQFNGVASPDYNQSDLGNIIKATYFLRLYLGIEHFDNLIQFLKIFLLWIETIIFPLFLLKNKKSFLFFVLTSVINLQFFIFVYGARPHHLYLFFIFAIVAYWIYLEELVFINLKKDKLALFFIFLSIQMCFISTYCRNGDFKIVADYINSDKNLASGKIFTTVEPIIFSTALPYLNKENIYVYNLKNQRLSSYESLQTYFNKKKKEYNPEDLYKFWSEDKNNFLISYDNTENKYLITPNGRIKRTVYKKLYINQEYSKIYIYKLERY